jgi:RHS repeat-associated protein
MKDRCRPIRNSSMQKLKLLALSSLLAGPLFGQMFDLSLAEGPRVSPLPLYYEDKGSFHKNLFGLADSGLHLQFLDAFAPAETQPLWIKREYRSGYDMHGVFGAGWVSNLDVRLEPSADKKDLRIFEASGKRTNYESENGSENYTAVVGTFLKSKVVRSADGHFVREWDNGVRETFNEQGRRESIAMGADKISFSYEGKSTKPVKITDAGGRKFELTYSGELLTTIKDSIGRKTQYRYEDQRLVETTDSLGRKDLFQYTGGKLSSLSLPGGQKMQFSYSPSGSLSQISGPGVLKTDFVWRSDADSPGQELVISYGNGTTESIAIEVGSLQDEKWKPAAKDGLAAADRIGFEFKHSGDGGAEVSSLLTNEQIYLKSRKDLFSLNGKGILARADRAIDQTKVRLSPLARGISVDQPAWRSQITPAYVPSGNDHIRYDGVGRPIEFLLDDNQKETWKWDNADRVIEWKAGDGSLTNYAYDAHNQLLEIKVNGAVFATFRYDEMGLLASAKSLGEEGTSYTYDARGNPVEARPGGGQTLHYKYDASNRLVEIESPQTGSSRIEYGANNLPAKLIGPGSRLHSFEYDADGNLSAESDETGTRAAYSKNEKGRLIVTRDTSGSEKAVQYDNEDRPLSLRNFSGETTEYGYDGEGRLASESTSNGQKRTFSYDSNGNYSKIEDGIVSVRYQYSKEGEKIVTAERAGQKSELKYDGQGNLLQEKDEDGNTTSYNYEGGQLRSLKLPSGVSVEYDYDSESRVRTVTQSLNDKKATVSYKYDPAGRLSGKTYEDGTTETFVYEKDGRLQETTDRNGGSYRYRYSAANQLEVIAGPFGDKTFKYDAQNRLIETNDSVEGKHVYDHLAGAAEIGVGDGSGRQSKVQLQTAGKPDVTEDILGGRIERQYDSARRLVAFVNPKGHRIEWKRDADGRILERKTATGKLYKTRYDERGNPSEFTLPNGGTIAWKYDAAGRPTEWSTRNEQGAGNSKWTYRYDKLGRLLDAQGPSGAFGTEYDALNRLVACRDPFGKSVSLSYDAPGRLESIRTPEGENVRYHYNPRGLADSVEIGGKKIAFSYDNTGRLSQILYPAGIKTSYQYDVGYRLAAISCQGADGKIIYQEKYSHDERGNVIAITDNQKTVSYKYDELSRLIAATHSDGLREEFKYDAAGNVTRTADIADWKYNEDEELVQLGDRKLTYDGAGNVADDGERQYSWDAAGRLTGATLPGGKKIEFAYDPAGRRIEKKDNSSDTRYLFAGDRLLAEYDGNGKLNVSFVPAADRADWLALRRDGKDYYPVRSYLGSLVAVVDESGRVVKRFQYDSYGRVIKAEGDLAIPPHYAGARVDEETGLVLMGARYYSPKLLRFLSPDSVGPDRDGNLYTYALQNPLRFRDSAGTMAEPFVNFTKDLGLPNGSEWEPFFYRQIQQMAGSKDPHIEQIGLQNLDVWHMTAPRAGSQRDLVKNFDQKALGGMQPLENGGYKFGVNSLAQAKNSKNAGEFVEKTLATYSHEAQHVSDLSKRVDELVEHGVPRADAVKAVMVDYNTNTGIRLEVEQRAFITEAKVSPTIGGRFPKGALTAEGELTQAAKDAIAAKYGSNWPGAKEAQIARDSNYLKTKYGMSEDDWLKHQKTDQWKATEEAYDELIKAQKSGRGIGAAEEALTLSKGSSRAGIVAAEEAAPSLVNRGVQAGGKVVKGVAKGAKSAVGVLAKGLKFLPIAMAAVEIANAENENDIALAVVHATPVLGELAQLAEAAADLGKNIGEGAADAYLHGKATYDHYKKVYDDLVKGMDAWDDALKKMGEADKAKRPKRRNAAANQLPTGDGGYLPLHGPNESGPNATGANTANANNAGSGGSSSGTGASGSTGATSGNAANNPSPGGNNLSNTNASAGSNTSANPRPPVGPTNPLGQDPNAGKPKDPATAGPNPVPPSNPNWGKPKDPATAGPNPGPAFSQSPSGGQAGPNTTGTNNPPAGSSNANAPLQSVGGGSSPAIATGRPLSGASSGPRGGTVSADNPPEQPAAPPAPDNPPSPSTDISPFKPIELPTKLIPPAPLPVPPPSGRDVLPGAPPPGDPSAASAPKPPSKTRGMTGALEKITKEIPEPEPNTEDPGLPPPPLPAPKPPGGETSPPPKSDPDNPPKPPPSQPPPSQPPPTTAPPSAPPKQAEPPSGYNKPPPGPNKVTPKNEPPPPPKKKSVWERLGDAVGGIFGGKSP